MTLTDDLERVARLTSELQPPRALAERVLDRIARAEREARAARRVALGLFSAVALLTAWASVEAQQRVDERALSSFDLVELER